MKSPQYLIIVLLLMLSSITYAQRPQEQRYDKEKFEAARVAFITNRLDLKPEQAEKFWPLFNKYNEERESLMRKMADFSKESEGNISENQAKQLIDQRFSVQSDMLKLDQKFMNDITKVITHKQAVALGGANRDFIRQIYRMNQRGRGGN